MLRERKVYMHGKLPGRSLTEVGVEVRQAAIDEIYSEISRLQEEPVDEEELDLVRNYMMGRLQNGLDGPFKVAGMYKGLYIYDLDIDYLYSLVETINTITPEHIMDLANRYFDPSTLHEITVG